jgi:hypothetical protein
LPLVCLEICGLRVLRQSALHESLRTDFDGRRREGFAEF